MRDPSLDRSSLMLEIKKAYLTGKREAARLTERFQVRLLSLMSESEFKLVSFNDGYLFRFRLPHDARSVVGGATKEADQVVLGSEELARLLSTIRQLLGRERILVFSNYPKEMPLVITTLEKFTDHYQHFLDLMEDDLSVISEDLADYIEINTENLECLDQATIKIVGDRFRCVMQGNE